MAITPLHPKNTSIIVVDDSPNDTAIFERAAKTFGIRRAHYFASAEHALQFLRRDGADVALIDYQLPGMNGLRLLEEIRREFPGTDVILVTGARDERVAAEAIKLGAKEFLSKDEYMTGGIIRALQATLRARIASQEAGLKDALLPQDGAIAAATAEARWLVEELSRHYHFDLPRAVLASDADLGDIAEVFTAYLKESFRVFPEPPGRAASDLVSTIVERGMSPRQIVMVYGIALRWLQAESAFSRSELPFSPALCLVLILAQVIEQYQSQLTVVQLGSGPGSETVPAAA